MIKPEGDEWVLYTHDGSKVLGRFKTEAQAQARERQIQYFKHLEASDAGVIKAVIGRLKGETTTTVQTVIFPKEGWTAATAKSWLAKHEFEAGDMRETGDSFRFQQHDEGEFEAGSFKTQEFGKAAASEGGPRFMVALSALADLTRMPLAMIGKWWKGKVHFSITREDLKRIVANFAKKANREVVIDYDHSTAYAAGGGEPAPAAGWIKSIDAEPDAAGMLWADAELTERARAMVGAREYKYFSPVIEWGARDKQTGEQQGATLTSGALTNVPFLDRMPAIALSEGWVVETTTEKKEVKAMAVNKLILADRGACTAKAVLEDGTETVLSVEGLEKPEPKVKVIALSEVKRTADGRYDFAALSEQEAPIAAEVMRAMTVQNEVDAAVKVGKILPAQRAALEKLPLADLRTFIASQKAQVDLSEAGVSGGGGGEVAEIDKVDAQLRQLVDAKLKANSKLTRGQALKLALSEAPELANRRAALMRE